MLQFMRSTGYRIIVGAPSRRFLLGIPLITSLSLVVIPTPMAATPGLPFTEDFSADNLKDEGFTTLNWDTDEEVLVLAAWKRSFGVLHTSLSTVSEIGTDVRDTQGIALGDVDGDGDIDVVTADDFSTPVTNRLYLNNGTDDPFSGVGAGSDIGTDADDSTSIALGDVDGDGDLDVVVGNAGQTNKLYKNNGTSTPFSGVTAGTDIGAQTNDTRAIALHDLNADGRLDVVVGNAGQTNKHYLNNGTGTPYSGVAGTDIGTGTGSTTALAVADIDGDGDIDVVAGNGGSGEQNRWYPGNGPCTAPCDPFSGVANGSPIGTSGYITNAVAVGDVDGDGDLDVVDGTNFLSAIKLFLNDGTSTPFSGATTGDSIGTDADNARDVALVDVDGDGDLDVVAGNDSGQADKVYLNDGTVAAFTALGSGTAITATADAVFAVGFADMDGDGDLDYVAGNSIGAGSLKNKLYLNNGTPSPFNGIAGGNAIGNTNDGSNAVAAGDVDKDGDLDVVVGNGAGGSQVPRLYLNNGCSPAPCDPFASVGAGIGLGSPGSADNAAVALADINADGLLDIVIGNNNSSGGITNVLWLNDGNSPPFSTTTPTAIGTDTDLTFDIEVADMDGDGDLDVVAGNLGATNKLAANNGPCAAPCDPFSSVSGQPVGSLDTDNTVDIAIGDINADGHPDVVAGNNVQANKFYINDGTSTPFSAVTAGTSIGSETDNTTGIGLADMDRDGDLDVVVGNSLAANKLYLNDGSPFSASTPALSFGAGDNSDDTSSIALGDVNADGSVDVIAANNGQTNKLYPSNGTGSPFSGLSNGIAIGTDTAGTKQAILTDIDRDGGMDVVSVDSANNRTYLSGGAVAGIANPFRGYLTGSAIGSGDTVNTLGLEVADMDGDGDLDVVAGDDGPNRLYLNNGTREPFSGIVNGTVIGTGDTDNTVDIALGDVDRDGDIDVVAGNGTSTANKLYLNNGTSTPFSGLVSGTLIGTADAHTTAGIVLGDVDRDGDLDVVAGNGLFTGVAANRLYLNNGCTAPCDPFSGITNGTVIGTSNNINRTFGIALADIDADGDLDLVSGNSRLGLFDSAINRLFLNNGTGTPYNVAGVAISTDTDTTGAIGVADMDSDGDLDVVAANVNQTNKLYLNNGTANPFNGVTTGTNIGTDTDQSSGLALADIDRDGDVDVIAGNTDVFGPADTTNKLYLNDGTATPFSGVTAGSPIGILDSDDTGRFTIADIDGDGDLDVLAGNLGQANRLYALVPYDLSVNRAGSIRVDTATSNIAGIRLTTTQTTPNNTAFDYYLSNNGGTNWFHVRPGVDFAFPTAGMDLRWRAHTASYSPIVTPTLDTLMLSLVVADIDMDGMPDQWEDDNGLDKNNPDDAATDKDGDGLTNLEEFQGGRDPQDPDEDADDIVDGLDRDPDSNANNLCLGLVDINGDVAFLQVVTTQKTCAARNSISIGSPAEVQAPNGDLRLIAPTVKVPSGNLFKVNNDAGLEILSLDPTETNPTEPPPP